MVTNVQLTSKPLPVLDPAIRNLKLAQVVLKKSEEKFVGQIGGQFVGFQPVLDLAYILEKPEISLDSENLKFQLFFIFSQSCDKFFRRE